MKLREKHAQLFLLLAKSAECIITTLAMNWHIVKQEQCLCVGKLFLKDFNCCVHLVEKFLAVKITGTSVSQCRSHIETVPVPSFWNISAVILGSPLLQLFVHTYCHALSLKLSSLITLNSLHAEIIYTFQFGNTEIA